MSAADASFERAHALLAEIGMPFEAALARLAHGAALRRNGHPRRAVAQLDGALASFDRLRAEPFSERCRIELAGCGQSRSARDAPPRLTPQEATVARLVVQGATNREVADMLMVSPKTVEHHLGRAYQKLGVRSRTELSVRMREHER